MYQYTSMAYTKAGDIVQLINNECLENITVDSIHIIFEEGVLGIRCKTINNGTLSVPHKRFKRIATKPGSEAVNGDSVIRVSSHSIGHVYHNIEVTNLEIRYRPGYSASKHDFLVLCKQSSSEIKPGSHWEHKTNSMFGNKGAIDIADKAYPDGSITIRTTVIGKKRFLELFKPRPDLDTVEQPKEQPMKESPEQEKAHAKLLSSILEEASAIGSETKVTTAEYICVLADDENNFLDHFYSQSEEHYTSEMGLEENAGSKLHVFKYHETIAQNPTKVVKVPRI